MQGQKLSSCGAEEFARKTFFYEPGVWLSCKGAFEVSFSEFFFFIMKNTCMKKWHVLETISIYKLLLEVKLPIPDRIFATKYNKATDLVKWSTVPLNNYQYYVSM